MYSHGYRDVPGSLFVAVHHGVRYTLVCVHDGRYAIAKNGWLMPARWRLKDFNMCFRTFMHMVGRTYKEPTPASCLLAEDLIAKQDPPGTLSFEPSHHPPHPEPATAAATSDDDDAAPPV